MAHIVLRVNSSLGSLRGVSFIAYPLEDGSPSTGRVGGSILSKLGAAILNHGQWKPETGNGFFFFFFFFFSGARVPGRRAQPCLESVDGLPGAPLGFQFSIRREGRIAGNLLVKLGALGFLVGPGGRSENIGCKEDSRRSR